jgi:protein O-mannosyl-transferase
LLAVGPAWLAAGFFAVHPVHVEAVANAVAQSELLVVLLHALAIAWYLSLRRSGTPGAGAILGLSLLYAGSCLCKESGIMLPALLLAAEVTVVGDRAEPRARLPALAPTYGAMFLVAACYLIVRGAVLADVVGEHPHPVLVGASMGARLLTMLAIVPEWWRLLLVPWHLQAAYDPPEFDLATTFGMSQLLGLTVLVAWGWLAWLTRRVYPVTSFGLAWVAITLFPVSNVLIPSGILLAERTLFSPSLGAALAVGGMAPWVVRQVGSSPLWQRRTVGGLLAAVLLLFGWRSAQRATMWRDNVTFARQTVLDAPLSYKAHATWGRVLFELGHQAEGEREYRTALQLYPKDPNVYAGLADRYRRAGLCGPAIPLFQESLRLGPWSTVARSMLIQCLVQTGDLAGAEAQLAEKADRQDSDVAQYRALLDSVRGTPSPGTAPRR